MHLGQKRLATAREQAGFVLFVIILGGIYGGIFTPTEAAAVAAIYAWVIASFVYRDMGPLATKEGAPKHLNFRKTASSCVTAIWHRDTIDTLFEAGKLTVDVVVRNRKRLILKHVLTV